MANFTLKTYLLILLLFILIAVKFHKVVLA